LEPPVMMATRSWRRPGLRRSSDCDCILVFGGVAMRSSAKLVVCVDRDPIIKLLTWASVRDMFREVWGRS